MAATINTNIASINAQRNLALSGQSLNTTMQRLSSGLRVNSAKDDAAGLAIAERMNTQVRGLTVASRNANDGISLAQTAEGALGKVGDMLQRMRELAVQAGNATNSASDRKALQAEVSQLSAEIDRVAKQTNFNGTKILDGSFAGAVFQVGANSGDNITVGALVDTRSSQLSSVSYGKSIEPTIGTATPIAAGQPLADFSTASLGELAIQVSAAGGISTTISLGSLPPADSPQQRLGQVVEAINKKSADTGVTAYLSKIDGTESYRVEILSEKLDADGNPLAVKFGSVAVPYTGTTATLNEPGDFSAAMTGFSTANVNIAGGAGTPTAATGSISGARGIQDVDVSTQAGAWVALKKIDSAVDQVNSARATLGAVQARFENTVNNIDIQVENLSAARGRIIDTDFAVETANLSRTQILQQAGTAMVAQANQIPQNVLQLLQG